MYKNIAANIYISNIPESGSIVELEIVVIDDRHQCIKSGNIPKTDDGQIIHNLCNSIMICMKFESFLEQKYSTGSMCLLTPTTVLGYVVVQKLTPLPQFLRNAVEKLAQDGRNITSKNPPKNLPSNRGSNNHKFWIKFLHEI